MSRNRYNSSWSTEGIAFVLFTIIMFSIVGFGVIRVAMYSTTISEISAVVETTSIKRIGESDRYLINVQLLDSDNALTGKYETLTVSDTFMFGNFNSADVYFELTRNIGKPYTFKLQGWRSGFMSEFPNIVEYKER